MHLCHLAESSLLPSLYISGIRETILVRIFELNCLLQSQVNIAVPSMKIMYTAINLCTVLNKYTISLDVS